MPLLIYPSSNHTGFLWDVLNPIQKIILLNQSAILVSEQWNVAQEFHISRDNIKWNLLPLNVQLVLLSEQSQQVFFNQTFQEWGWVEATSPFSNYTLLSLLTDEGQAFFNNVLEQMKGLTFNTVLNLKLVYKSKKGNCVARFVKHLHKSYIFYLKPEYKNYHHKTESGIKKSQSRPHHLSQKQYLHHGRVVKGLGPVKEQRIQTPSDVFQLVNSNAFRILMKN